MRQPHPDLFHLAHHHPMEPQRWELRYRTRAGVPARAVVRLEGLQLLAQVHYRAGRMAELRSRDPHALADFLDIDAETVARPFRRVR